ncbi:MAG: amylo-alpha-1,6-glucosidase [Pyrinomonadaceae bacterium]
MLAMIKFDSEICTNFETASTREWLETNGIGGFASSTVSGANTRRYHGLLTAATRPPLGRLTTLSKFEETLTIDDKSFELSSNKYPNAIDPEGFQYLKSFCLDPFPVWIYEIEGIEIEKKIFMPDGENTTVCQWNLKVQSSKFKVQSPNVSLELKPLFSFVDYHSLQHETGEINMNYQTEETLVSIKPFEGLPEIFLCHNAREIEKTGFWYRNFEYAIEEERGFDFREDLFQPFALKFDLSDAAIVIASTEKQDFSNAEKHEKAEIERRRNLIKIAGAKTDLHKELVLAADQFIVRRGEGKTVIAGYPWFSDWGRDTMISLPGLTLATNRVPIAKEIILEFSNHISEGMLPNRFPDAADEAEYNTVDATLWYFEAIRAYAEKTGDYDFIQNELYAKLADIIFCHLRGTRYNIHVDTDGLLYAGEEGTQLTWMDAKYGDEVFTPRIGKPVEIQALWYNALRVMADFAERFEHAEDQKRYSQMADIAKEHFNQTFWNEDEQCLFDVVINGRRDASVRPNQIFAVSLHHAILDDAKRARKVVEKVEKHLLTPVGLRSLAPDDMSYHSIYIGSPFERDSAYHQGTVWAWLICGFVDALRKTSENKEETEAKIAEILRGFEAHLSEAGVGQISEIFDADAPFKPRGCFSQAWSVAEVLRVLQKEN